MPWIKALPIRPCVRKSLYRFLWRGGIQGLLQVNLHSMTWIQEPSTSSALLTMLYVSLLLHERNKSAFAAWIPLWYAEWKHLVQDESMGVQCNGERNRDFPLSKHRKHNSKCKGNTKELSGDFTSFKTHPCQKNSLTNYTRASHKMYMLS